MDASLSPNKPRQISGTDNANTHIVGLESGGDKIYMLWGPPTAPSSNGSTSHSKQCPSHRLAEQRQQQRPWQPMTVGARQRLAPQQLVHPFQLQYWHCLGDQLLKQEGEGQRVAGQGKGQWGLKVGG